jgi:hypothetical protein
MSDIPVFVSFDPQHDQELFELLLTQSRTQSSGFSIIGSSSGATAEALDHDRTLNSIREASQLIVLCGEHSESSTSMTAELTIAEQEDKPYFLVWGRREIMCTKPTGAKSSEGMYSWTLPILRDQLEQMTRSSKRKTPTDEFKLAAKTKRQSDDPPSS